MYILKKYDLLLKIKLFPKPIKVIFIKEAQNIVKDLEHGSNIIFSLVYVIIKIWTYERPPTARYLWPPKLESFSRIIASIKR